MPQDVSGYLSKVALTAEIPSELGTFVYNAFKSIFTTRKLVAGGSQQTLKLLVLWHPIELTTGLPGLLILYIFGKQGAYDFIYITLILLL